MLSILNIDIDTKGRARYYATNNFHHNFQMYCSADISFIVQLVSTDVACVSFHTALKTGYRNPCIIANYFVIVFLYLQMFLLYSSLFVILSLCTCPVTSLRACGGELTNLLMEHCGEMKRVDLPPVKRIGSADESFENNELVEKNGYSDVFQKGKSERK